MPQRIRYQPPTNQENLAPPPQLGTLLYRGAVPPTKGEWLGIEWDEASRGKHSGTHEKTGVRYFETRVEGAGSFLRPDAPGLVLDGRSFREAFEARYGVHAASPSRNEDETVPSQFHKTLSNFEVEVVPAKFRHLRRLREAGLEWTCLDSAYGVGKEDERASLSDFGASLSGLEALDLSYTMLPSLTEAAHIALSLPRLSILSLNSNRFDSICPSLSLPGFERLTKIRLNNTLLTWPEIVRISPSLPNVTALEVGSNRLVSLACSSETSETRKLYPKLAVLNLEGNRLSDWSGTVRALSNLPSLDTLVLSSNCFADLVLPISHPTSIALRNLRHLDLRTNLLASWSTTVDALGASIRSAFPLLTTLDVANNPLADIRSSHSPSFGSDLSFRDRAWLQSRLGIIARLSQITTLEGTPVSAVERDEAERFWIETPSIGGAEELSAWARGRRDELVRRTSLHAMAREIRSLSVKLTFARSQRISPTTLHALVLLKPLSLCDPVSFVRTVLDAYKSAAVVSRLTLLLFLTSGLRVVTASPSKTDVGDLVLDSSLELSVLPTLRTVLLRARLSRLLRKTLPPHHFRLVGWLRSHVTAVEGTGSLQAYSRPPWVRVDILADEEGREVAWWGFQDGDVIGVEAV